MPTKTAALESIERLHDLEHVSFEGAKLRASTEDDEFIGERFEVGISNVGRPQVQVIQLGQKGDNAQGSQRNDSRVNTCNGSGSEMPSSYKSSLVSTIVLDSEDQVDCDLLVVFWNGGSCSEVGERLIFVQLSDLETNGDIP